MSSKTHVPGAHLPDVPASHSLDTASREAARTTRAISSSDETLLDEESPSAAGHAPERLDSGCRCGNYCGAQLLDIVEGLLLEENLGQTHLYALFAAYVFEGAPPLTCRRRAGR